MKKVNLINLKGISEILSEKELKNVMGGSGSPSCPGACDGESCSVNGYTGRCGKTYDTGSSSTYRCTCAYAYVG
jgi:natural product precursor